VRATPVTEDECKGDGRQGRNPALRLIGVLDRADSREQPVSDKRARAFAEKSNAIYEKMLRRLKAKENPEELLRWVGIVAGFAWMFHTGRYADGRVENPAFEVGRRLNDLLPDTDRPSSASGARPSVKQARRRVLHVATTLYSVGGHSRLINSWIRNDKSSEHSLVLTNQQGTEIPEWMTRTVTDSGGTLISLTAERYLLEKAGSLRRIAQSGFDAVVLHQHPSDVVPVVAFAAPECPPVALMNHADHVFGLGASVADAILNLRGFGERISRTRRFAKKTLLLPVPLSIPSLSITKAEARSRLGIPQEQVVLLSIGTRYKFTPTEEHNFFSTADKILTRNTAAHLYVIGIGADSSATYVGQAGNERIHFLGTVEDPALYRLSADLYIDSMPYGSLTAMLETAALGVCPVLMYAPPSLQYDLSEDVGFSGLAACTENEDEYLAAVNHLIDHPELRREIGGQVRESMLANHEGEKWKQYLEAVYDYLAAASHSPAAIPSAEFMQTGDDLVICDFNSIVYSGTPLLRQAVGSYFNILTLKDMMSLFLLSIRTRDHRFSYTESRYWLEMFWSKLFKEPEASAGADSVNNRSLKAAG
jgi:glycosyltransferase involved in cell wall biosynthesis